MLRTGRRPSRSAIWILTIAVLLCAGGVVAALDVDAEAEKAARTILCDCGCHPQSAHDCACGRAEAMRGEILAAVQSGKTGDQVIAAYVERSGETVRIVPTTKGFNLLAWLGPGAAFLAALGFVALVLTRWRRKLPGVEKTDLPAPPVDDAYAARLRRELEDFR